VVVQETLTHRSDVAMTDKDPTEINDVAPSSIRHIIGQFGVVAQVSVAIDAAFADDKKFDDSLLVGPPGLGKSALAQVIACERAATFHEMLGQDIRSIADLNSLLLTAKHHHVVHIDEVHLLTKPFQTALYRALDKREIAISSGRKTLYRLPLHDFTLLLSTTDEHDLLQPLRDRMKMILRFEYYSAPTLAAIVDIRSRALRWDTEQDVCRLISHRSRGTPRLALRLLNSCRRVCRAEGDTTITVDHLQRACSLEQLDELGLGPTEQKYLMAVADGASRLNVVASILGLPTKTVAEVVEPFLLRANLLVKDDQGRRELTAEGRGHLSRLRSDSD
jgi:Holliday junction DNA helicase RuvB